MKDRTRKIIVAVFLVIAVCCAGYLIWYYATAAKTKQSYDDAKKLATENVKPSKTDSDDGEQTKPEIPVDFTVLQEKNPDIYAWIKIDGTTVDYPVCQNNEDDNYYLSHTWERVEAADGAIFTQACNSKNFTDFNTVIYGHQMGEGVDTMFHTLDRYLEEGYIEKYPNAKFYANKAEYEFALDPIPMYYKSYESDVLGIHNPIKDVKFELFEGEKELLPGIVVFDTPGHSPGHCCRSGYRRWKVYHCWRCSFWIIHI